MIDRDCLTAPASACLQPCPQRRHRPPRRLYSLRQAFLRRLQPSHERGQWHQSQRRKVLLLCLSRPYREKGLHQKQRREICPRMCHRPRHRASTSLPRTSCSRSSIKCLTCRHIRPPQSQTPKSRALEAELAEVLHKQNNLLTALENGSSARLVQRLQDLEQQESTIRVRLAAIPGSPCAAPLHPRRAGIHAQPIPAR